MHSWRVRPFYFTCYNPKALLLGLCCGHVTLKLGCHCWQRHLQLAAVPAAGSPCGWRSLWLEVPAAGGPCFAALHGTVKCTSPGDSENQCSSSTSATNVRLTTLQNRKICLPDRVPHWASEFPLDWIKNPTSSCFWIYHQCKGPLSS